MLKDRAYSVLIVSASENFNTSLMPLLPEGRFSHRSVAGNVSEAKRISAERDFDFVIINSPLSDEFGTRFAVDLSTSKPSVALLLVKSDIYDEIYEKVSPYGVFTLAKPLSAPTMTRAISWMATTRERLRKFEIKTLSIEEKMEEIRLVNRAKWLLINHLKMSENEAHRYIEKQAMDRCVQKRTVAGEIIKTYT